MSIDARTLAQAVRCQLLTGSYDGATRSCACVSPDKCVLTEAMRSELETHPSVVAALARNLLEALEALED